MPKSSEHHDFLPPEARVALERLRAHLALARKCRLEPLRAWPNRSTGPTCGPSGGRCCEAACGRHPM